MYAPGVLLGWSIAALILADGGPAHVIGGNVAQTCQWPSTVLMSGCSGTLVHPEIILYAAHCPGAGAARFGVTGNDRSVGISYCEAAPEYPKLGFDYAYCRLNQPVTDVPIIPILMGCEVDQLEIGARVTLVGFGNTSDSGGGFGTKRWIEGDIAGFPNGGRKIGIFYDTNDEGICNGDSGGSGFVRLEDGSWRHWGIASTVAGSCGGSSQHIPSWHAVAWVEEDSGIDITPCHDADGAWNPSPECTSFPLDPDDGSGLSWAQGCGPGSVSPAAATCGPAVGEPQDTSAPVIEFVAPAPGAHPGPLFDTSIEVTASDDWGILDVAIVFDGAEQAAFEAPPYTISTVAFPEGSWEIVATARDWSGNLAEASVMIEVGNVDVPPETSGTEDTGGPGPTGDGTSSPTDPTTDPEPEGSSGEDTGTGSTTGAAGGGEDGCGCRTSPQPGATWMLVLLGLLTVPSRTRRPSVRAHRPRVPRSRSWEASPAPR